MTKKSCFLAKKCVPAKTRQPVQVVQCPSDFPPSNHRDGGKRSSSRGQQNDGMSDSKHDKSDLLDWNETTRQVRSLASTAFMGKTKRHYQQEEYERLTGRKMKEQKVPIDIVRGIRKKARERQEKLVEEARLNGIVLATTTRGLMRDDKRKNNNRSSHASGPAPSIGYVKSGVYRFKHDKKRR